MTTLSKRRELRGWAIHRNIIAGAAVATAAGYLAYKAYHSKSLANTQSVLLRAAETLQRLGAAAGAAGAALELVATDLRDFLASDSDEVPRSIRQLAKLATSPEVQDAISACAGAAARGAAAPALHAALPLVDRLLDALMSERGSNLVALAISVAAREGTGALVASLHQAVLASVPPDFVVASFPHGPGGPTAAAAGPWQHPPAPAAAARPAPPGLAGAAGALLSRSLALLQSPPGDRLIRSLVSSGVGGAVDGFADQAAGLDLYGPFFSALSRPEHRRALAELAAAASGAACREMVAAACGAPPAGAPAGGWLLLSDELEPERQADGDSERFGSGQAPHADDTEEIHPAVAAAAALGGPFGVPHVGPSRSGSAPSLAGPLSWMVAACAQAARHPEIRSLMLEMSQSSTREFVRNLLPGFWTGDRGSGGGGERQLHQRRSAPAGLVSAALLHLQVHRLQVMLSVLVVLFLYALAARSLLPTIAVE